MGSYDRVWFSCPACGNRIEVQSKAGKCEFDDHESAAVPLDIVSSIEGEIVQCRDRSTYDDDGEPMSFKGRGRQWQVRSLVDIKAIPMGLAPV